MSAIKYNGYTIELEDDPWAKKFGSKFKFYFEDGGEVIHSASSIEDAKDQIDEGSLRNDYDPNPEAWSGGIADNH